MTTGARADLEDGHVTSRRGGASPASSATAGLEQAAAAAEVSAHTKTSPAFLPSL